MSIGQFFNIRKRKSLALNGNKLERHSVSPTARGKWTNIYCAVNFPQQQQPEWEKYYPLLSPIIHILWGNMARSDEILFPSSSPPHNKLRFQKKKSRLEQKVLHCYYK